MKAMEDTIITVYYFQNFLLGIHMCPKKSIDYIKQSALSAYNCLVQGNQINEKIKMYCIAFSDKVPQIVIVNPLLVGLDGLTTVAVEQSYKNFAQLIVPSDLTNIKIDTVTVVCSDNIIDYYLPHINISINNLESKYVKLLFDRVVDTLNKLENKNILHVHTLIFDKIKSEKQYLF
jgi:hypothetical protein